VVPYDGPTNQCGAPMTIITIIAMSMINGANQGLTAGRNSRSEQNRV
jgi:hypothetical protein